VLITILISALVAGVVSAGVGFAFSWVPGVRVGRVERELADLQSDLLREKRSRAGLASVGARASKAAQFDAEIVKQHTGVDLPQASEDEPWWGGIVKKRA